MTERRPASWDGTTVAMARANVRYWSSVAPRVRAQLRRWQAYAETIRDPVLRALATGKLRSDGFNTEATATLYTLAPRAHRRAAIDAGVALEVMYDYIDTLTEEPLEDPLRSAGQLFRSFGVALDPDAEPTDYYRHYPQKDDSGFLDALVAQARESLAELPGMAAALPVALHAAERFGEAQTRSHATWREGTAQLERWAAPRAAGMNLAWWELAGGSAGSVLALHAVLSAAADPRTTPDEALRIDRAYLLNSVLTTMLDSLVDDEHDEAVDGHRYIAYYPTPEAARARLADVAREALAAARDLPHSRHHVMTVAGIAGFYLSAAHPRDERVRSIADDVIDALRPNVVPALAIFRAWRQAKRARAWIDSRRHGRATPPGG